MRLVWGNEYISHLPRWFFWIKINSLCFSKLKYKCCEIFFREDWYMLWAAALWELTTEKYSIIMILFPCIASGENPLLPKMSTPPITCNSVNFWDSVYGLGLNAWNYGPSEWLNFNFFIFSSLISTSVLTRRKIKYQLTCLK